MSTNTVVLILGLAVIAGIIFVLVRIVKNKGSGGASFSLANIFKAEIRVGAQEKEAARTAVEQAAKSRGQAPSSSTADLLATVSKRHLTRVLWVDDHPDNNLYETTALEKLGYVVTSATTTDAALTYLKELEFSIAITDMGRGNDPRAGYDFLQRSIAIKPNLVVILYTMAAEPFREPFAAAGGAGVSDEPSGLLQLVLTASH